MLDKLLIHPTTKNQLEQYIMRPSHALLLVGSLGSGKKTVAKVIASHALAIDSGSALESYPFFYHILPIDKKEISIVQVRELIGSLKLKTPGDDPLRRIVFIEDANLMSVEAQNALLKILEEPSSETMFILTVPSELSVLPTIGSRTQKIHLRQVSLHESQQYFEQDYTQADIEANWLLSHGSPGLMSALLKQDQNHPLKQALDQAKKILHQKKYERLQTLELLAKDKPQLALVLEALKKVLTALQHNAARSENLKSVNRLLAARKLVNELQMALEQNVSPKLVNLKLVTNLKL